MGYSIKINLTKATGDYDPGASKLFGAPTVPQGWEDKFAEDIIFFGQIRLSDIAELDTENKLPHTGYLYLFLDTEMYPYTAFAEYYDGEPDMIIDDFNELDPEFAHLTEDFLMSFELCDEGADGNKLFGHPSSYDHEPERELCMQFDPLEVSTGFLEEIDGYAYFFFGENGTERIDNMHFEIDRS